MNAYEQMIEDLQEEATIAYYESGAQYEGARMEDWIDEWIEDNQPKQLKGTTP